MTSLTAARVRSVIAGLRTEKDIETALRSHRIRYSYDTTTGFLSFRIPARSGSVRIFRTCSRSCPFQVQTVPAKPAPVPGFSLRYTANYDY